MQWACCEARRAGQAGVEQSGTPVDERHTRLIAPFGGDRLFVNGLLPPRWGLDVCAQLLQGCNEAKPSVTPAYALVAPSGAFPLTSPNGLYRTPDDNE